MPLIRRLRWIAGFILGMLGHAGTSRAQDVPPALPPLTSRPGWSPLRGGPSRYLSPAPPRRSSRSRPEGSGRPGLASRSTRLRSSAPIQACAFQGPIVALAEDPGQVLGLPRGVRAQAPGRCSTTTAGSWPPTVPRPGWSFTSTTSSRGHPS